MNTQALNTAIEGLQTEFGCKISVKFVYNYDNDYTHIRNTGEGRKVTTCIREYFVVKSVKIDDDGVEFPECCDTYEEFINALRNAVVCKKIFDAELYDRIARDIIEYDGAKTCFEYKINGMNIMVSYNSFGGWWESYVTNEDLIEISDNFDIDHFENILEMMKEDNAKANRTRFETEQHLRRTA